MFKLQSKDKTSVKVKGWFMKPITWVLNVPTGNWLQFFGDFQDQRFGRWDSDSCWALSAINSVEDQLNWLWVNGYFNPEAKAFFLSNNYCDANGVFSLSEMFHEILCGQRDQGGTSPMAWQSFFDKGFIPRSQLTYTVAQSNQWNSQEEFNNDYFNPAKVTPAMIILGQQSKNYIKTAYQTIGKSYVTPSLLNLTQALKQAPLCIGIPIPADVQSWNSPIVKYDGGRIPAHEVELYGIDDKGQYLIFDQYEPHLKVLSADYLLIFVTQGIVYAVAPATTNPIPQPTQSQVDFWTAVQNWWNGIWSSIPVGQNNISSS